MKYLLTFVADQARMKDAAKEEIRAAMEAWNQFNSDAIEAGVMIACEPLELGQEATTIRVDENGHHTITDGPFAETKEQLGGFCLLEVEDFDEAMRWAKRVPVSQKSATEVRRVMDVSAFGYESPTVSPVNARATA
jgi:hypothetical protein